MTARRGCAILLLTEKDTKELKNVFDYEERTKLLQGPYTAEDRLLRGKAVLLFDGNWPTRNIRIDRQEKDFEFYVAKDREMVRAASYGLMIWDGKSKGTLNNIVELVRQEKKVLVYFSPGRSFSVVKSSADVVDLVRRCHTTDQQRFKREFSSSSKLAGSQPAFDLFSSPRR